MELCRSLLPFAVIDNASTANRLHYLTAIICLKELHPVSAEHSELGNETSCKGTQPNDPVCRPTPIDCSCGTCLQLSLQLSSEQTPSIRSHNWQIITATGALLADIRMSTYHGHASLQLHMMPSHKRLLKHMLCTYVLQQGIVKAVEMCCTDSPQRQHLNL